MPLVPADVLRDFQAAIYRAAGAADDEAEVVAEMLVAANLTGHDSHGVMRTPRYVKQMSSGELVPGAPFVVEQQVGSTAVVDGNWGFGFVQTKRAMNLAMDLAREHGIGSVAIRYQGHVGRLGTYTEMAAANGMIGLITADSGRGPKAVAPFGGRDARLGTNPICMAVPRANGAPAVLDMATSAVAAGKIAVAKSRGQRLGDGWAVAADGSPATDPEQFYDGGALLPLGGDQGHKGFGLAFMVEVLCGILTGLGFGVAEDGRHNDGCFLLVMDIKRFRDLPTFLGEMDEFVDYLKSSRLAAGVDEILYPGELEARTSIARGQDGIPIEEKTWTALSELAGTLGVTVPDVEVG